jgi:signal transduction histidine kinase
MLITVEDSGKGFDPSWIDILTGGTKGFGLFNVRERIRNLGGTVEILSRPGNGTRVILQVPLNIA